MSIRRLNILPGQAQPAWAWVLIPRLAGLLADPLELVLRLELSARPAG